MGLLGRSHEELEVDGIDRTYADGSEFGRWGLPISWANSESNARKSSLRFGNDGITCFSISFQKLNTPHTMLNFLRPYPINWIIIEVSE